jgi:signal transduction histidine kinase
MKIKKGEFKRKEISTSNILEHIKNVLSPFETQILKSELMILTNIDFPKNTKAIADFEMFELILFNIIQNAIKYNNIKGHVIINLSLNADNIIENEAEGKIRSLM